jgi:hypothetical protein
MGSSTKTEPQAEVRVEHQPLAFCGQRVLNNCALHDSRLVHFDGDPASCPVCNERCAHAETRGRLKCCKEEIDRLKKVEKDNAKLESRIFELEDRLSEELADTEDDQSYEEPRRPEEMAARHGLNVSAGLRGEEAADHG